MMIKKIRIVGEVAIVTATATFHPLRQIKQLKIDLDLLGFEGLVLFDLLAVNGIAPNRFASMKFSKRGFERASFSIEATIDNNIKAEQDSLAQNDNSFLMGSVLSTSELNNFRH